MFCVFLFVFMSFCLFVLVIFFLSIFKSYFFSVVIVARVSFVGSLIIVSVSFLFLILFLFVFVCLKIFFSLLLSVSNFLVFGLLNGFISFSSFIFARSSSARRVVFFVILCLCNVLFVWLWFCVSVSRMCLELYLVFWNFFVRFIVFLMVMMVLLLNVLKNLYCVIFCGFDVFVMLCVFVFVWDLCRVLKNDLLCDWCVVCVLSVVYCIVLCVVLWCKLMLWLWCVIYCVFMCVWCMWCFMCVVDIDVDGVGVFMLLCLYCVNVLNEEMWIDFVECVKFVG